VHSFSAKKSQAKTSKRQQSDWCWVTFLFLLNIYINGHFIWHTHRLTLQYNLYTSHRQICTLPQTYDHANIPPFSFYRPDAFPVAQPTKATGNSRSGIPGNLTTQKFPREFPGILRIVICNFFCRPTYQNSAASTLPIVFESRITGALVLVLNEYSNTRLWNQQGIWRVTWRHRSRDDSILHVPFPIGAPLYPSL